MCISFGRLKQKDCPEFEAVSSWALSKTLAAMKCTVLSPCICKTHFHEKKFLLFYVSVDVDVNMYMHTSAQRCQTKVVDTPELELQTIVNHPTWVLVFELKFSGRLGNALNC